MFVLFVVVECYLKLVLILFASYRLSSAQKLRFPSMSALGLSSRLFLSRRLLGPRGV